MAGTCISFERLYIDSDSHVDPSVYARARDLAVAIASTCKRSTPGGEIAFTDNTSITVEPLATVEGNPPLPQHCA